MWTINDRLGEPDDPSESYANGCMGMFVTGVFAAIFWFGIYLLVRALLQCL
jgi:hypothetical protein